MEQSRDGRNKTGLIALTSMPRKSDPTTRARAEALFKRRQEQAADAPKAMAEYRAAESARYARMRELRAMRLAREAQLRSEQVRTPVRESARNS